MKQAVLITKNPILYAEAIAGSPCQWFLLTKIEELPAILKRQTIESVFVDTGSFPLPVSLPGCPLPPTVIFAEEETLIRLLQQANDSMPTAVSPGIERRLDRLLQKLAFSPALRGYRYLKEALCYEYQNRREILAVKKDIYETVSQRFHTSVPSVERGISFAVRKAYRQNPAGFQAVFPALGAPPGNMTLLKTLVICLSEEAP